MKRSKRAVRILAWSAVALACLMGARAQADSAPELRFDPFRTPSEEVATGPASGKRGDVSDRFSPVLRSTVVADSKVLVNLGGELLGIGEQTHGYQLISVGRYHAVFEKDGRRVTLEVEGKGVGSP